MKVARRQYLAGERCALAGERLVSHLPGLYAAALRGVESRFPKLTAAQQARVLSEAQALEKSPSRRVAAVNALIARLKDVPRSVIAGLRQAANQPITITPQLLSPTVLLPAPAETASTALLDKQEAQIFAAAARADLKRVKKSR